MDLGLLVLRGVIGGLFTIRGGQRLFGWFGGPGIDRAADAARGLGFPNGRVAAAVIGAVELGSGAAFVLGVVQPLAAAGVVATMLSTCIAHGLHRSGLWVGNGGVEYPIVLAAVSVGLAATGPGALSVGAGLGIDAAGWYWMLIAAALGILGGTALVGARTAPGVRHADGGHGQHV